MGSIITLSIVQSALELGFIYALVAHCIIRIIFHIDIADLSTDGCFTLGCAVCATVSLPVIRCSDCLRRRQQESVSGFVTAFLQTRMGISPF